MIGRLGQGEFNMMLHFFIEIFSAYHHSPKFLPVVHINEKENIKLFTVPLFFSLM